MSKMSFGKKKEDEEGTKLTRVHSRIRVGKKKRLEAKDPAL